MKVLGKGESCNTSITLCDHCPDYGPSWTILQLHVPLITSRLCCIFIWQSHFSSVQKLIVAALMKGNPRQSIKCRIGVASFYSQDALSSL